MVNDNCPQKFLYTQIKFVPQIIANIGSISRICLPTIYIYFHVTSPVFPIVGI